MEKEGVGRPIIGMAALRSAGEGKGKGRPNPLDGLKPANGPQVAGKRFAW